MVETQAIVVLDFGAQYSQLIARRIRELNVFSVVLPCTASLEEIKSYRPAGIVLSGGPCSVYDADAPPADEQVLHLGLPVLGICYGLQYMVYKLGGKVRAAEKREYGHAQVEVLRRDSVLFKGLRVPLEVWMSHGDEAMELPPGFELIGKTSNAVAAIQNPAQKYYAVQFHPEVHHTPQGTEILRNFVFDICGLKPNWTPQSFIDETVASVRQTVGKGRVICALSGGVDSSVAAELVHRAIGDQLTCIFVNNGVLRKNEFINVQKNLREKLGLNIDAVDASERFLTKLAGVIEPEQKRKIIGNEFIMVFEEEAHRLEQLHGKVEWLVQGTLYPDVIESRSVRGPSQTIKSHHNVGGLPDVMKLKLIEPLKDLFKDEVRKIGRDLGMPEDLLQRQPFPGPGSGGAHPGRGHARARGAAPGGRRHRGQRDQAGGTLQEDMAVVCRAAASDVGGRHGRHANVRVHLRDPRGAFRRRHDRRLGAAAARGAEDHLQPDRERGEGHQPRGVRRDLEAAGDD